MENKVSARPPLRWDLQRLKNDPEKAFFLLSGFWFLFMVLGGFADSFYFSESLTPNPLYIKIHAVSYSFWVLLYLVQSGFVATGNTSWHRKLGQITLVVLLVLWASGYYTVLYKAVQGANSLPDTGRNLFEIGMGIVLVILAFIQRRKPYVHKRLMLAGMVFLTIAAVPRIILGFWNLEINVWAYYGFHLGPLAALVVFDLLYFKSWKWLSTLLLLGIFVIEFFRLPGKFFASDFGSKILEGLVGLF